MIQDAVADVFASTRCKQFYRLIETREAAVCCKADHLPLPDQGSQRRRSDSFIDEEEDINIFVRVHSRRFMFTRNTIWHALASMG
jgi:hypothetical protein